MTLNEELQVSSKSKLVKQLKDMGYQSIDDLDGVHIPSLIDRGIGWSGIKTIIARLVDLERSFSFQKPDDTWTEERWEIFIKELVDLNIITWKEIAVCVLGELNPPQVGTSTASNPNFKKQYPPRKCMEAVMGWFYSQKGECSVCGSYLHLEVDHIKGKNEFLIENKDPSEADTLDNLQLLCKRCNVIKRESHKLGGLSFFTAQAALMWILFAEKPKTYKEYKSLCRKAGLTMADVRFQESWAMAIWLSKKNLYTINDSKNS